MGRANLFRRTRASFRQGVFPRPATSAFHGRYGLGGCQASGGSYAGEALLGFFQKPFYGLEFLDLEFNFADDFFHVTGSLFRE